jgi:hypothetical protein
MIYWQLGATALLTALVGLLLYDRFFRRQDLLPPTSSGMPRTEFISDRFVLLIIAAGLIGIILAIVQVIYSAASADKVLPNWAENVFVAISTAAILKLGDCLNTLVALVTGRQVERLGNKLADSQPASAGEGTTTENMQVDAENVNVRKGGK